MTDSLCAQENAGNKKPYCETEVSVAVCMFKKMCWVFFCLFLCFVYLTLRNEVFFYIEE